MAVTVSDCPLMVLGFAQGTRNWSGHVADLKSSDGREYFRSELRFIRLIDLRNEFDLKVKVG